MIRALPAPAPSLLTSLREPDLGSLSGWYDADDTPSTGVVTR